MTKRLVEPSVKPFLSSALPSTISELPTDCRGPGSFQDRWSRRIGLWDSRGLSFAFSIPRYFFSLRSFFPMALRKNLHGDTAEVFLLGRIDGAAANEFEVEVIALMKQGINTIWVNCAEANFLCSAAIRVLLQYHRQLKAQKKTFLISRVSPEVDSILEMTGFRDLLVEKTTS